MTSAEWGDGSPGGAASSWLFDQDDDRTTWGPAALGAGPPPRAPATPPPRSLPARPGPGRSATELGFGVEPGPPPDPAFAHRIPDGVRLAVPEPNRWHLPRKLPTRPTLFGGAGAVVLAFLVGLSLGSGGGSTVATKPAASVAPTTTTTLAPPTTHTVAVGETLASIAATNHVSVQDLAGFNNITDLNHVFVGEVLRVPGALPTTTTTTPLNR